MQTLNQSIQLTTASQGRNSIFEKILLSYNLKLSILSDDKQMFQNKVFRCKTQASNKKDNYINAGLCGQALEVDEEHQSNKPWMIHVLLSFNSYYQLKV
ncbi:unnamed protein product [Paramecium pentaurelia]|uniref:Uncharacterized protein n=1 Tax=Paramecium pentaurelia TaxID=43138 RepID=A0A8S1V1J7_9CILI|nr:unnamed protein product [Paramecium pentaurelia]